MPYSSLATFRVPAYVENYTKGRSSKIKEITVHHMSGKLTAQRCGELFQAVGRCGSSHYGIGYEGEIANYVDEADTAWTNSHWVSNCRAVTIEVSNSLNAYPWPVSDASLNSLIRLIADIARRNGLGTLVKGKNLTWHQMYAATDCPGDYLLAKMDYIVSEANKLITGKTGTAAKPNTLTVGYKYNGINTSRGTGQLVVYRSKATTGTNPYGYEVPVDKNGVVLSSPVYKGNSAIPSGGFVLSGHLSGKCESAGAWLYGNIRKGYFVSVNADGNIYVDKWQHRSVDGVNTGRGEGQLIIYKGKATTGTNPYGFEVPVDRNGYAVSNPAYKGDTAIPEGGFVLSGHLSGKGESAGHWIYENIKKGTHVKFDGKVVSII